MAAFFLFGTQVESQLLFVKSNHPMITNTIYLIFSTNPWIEPLYMYILKYIYTTVSLGMYVSICTYVLQGREHSFIHVCIICVSPW